MTSRVLLHLAAWVFYMILVFGYNDLNENFSYEELAKNRTGLKIHLDCFINKGPCDDIAAHYKSHIRDSVWNDCKYCTKKHMHNAHVFLEAIKREFPEETKELKKMYDEQGAHFKSMEEIVDRYKK